MVERTAVRGWPPVARPIRANRARLAGHSQGSPLFAQEDFRNILTVHFEGVSVGRGDGKRGPCALRPQELEVASRLGAPSVWARVAVRARRCTNITSVTYNLHNHIHNL